MVFFLTVDSGLQVRCFLESPYQWHTSNESSVKVKVPVSVVDNDSFKSSNALLMLSWSRNSRKVQVQGGMLDQYRSVTETFWKHCHTGRVITTPRGVAQAASMLRCPASSQYFCSNKRNSLLPKARTTHVPPGLWFEAVVGQITSDESILFGVMASVARNSCEFDGG